MNVFLSYWREDEARALLVARILTAAMIECLVDRQLRAAQPLETGLRKMIRKCNLVVVLLTRASLNPARVNQLSEVMPLRLSVFTSYWSITHSNALRLPRRYWK